MLVGCTVPICEAITFVNKIVGDHIGVLSPVDNQLGILGRIEGLEGTVLDVFAATLYLYVVEHDALVAQIVLRLLGHP